MINSESKVLSFSDGYMPIGEISDNVLWDGSKFTETEVKEISPEPQYAVTLFNGRTIYCGESAEIKTNQKKLSGRGWTPITELDKSYRVILNTSEVFYKDIDQLLPNISNYDLGVLIGLNYSTNIPFNFPASSAAVGSLRKILETARMPYTEKVYALRANGEHQRIEFTIYDYKGTSDYFIDIDVPQVMWKSKEMMRGFLMSSMSFSKRGYQMFTFKTPREHRVASSMQEMLTLFGVNSSFTKGLNQASDLIISKFNCYRFLYRVGALYDLDKILDKVDYKRFVKYNDITRADMEYSRVMHIAKVAAPERMFRIASGQLMVDGILLK